MNASSPYAPVPSLNLVSITESLIRLSILSTLLYCPEQNDQDAPIYRRTPHTTTSDLLYDEELQLLEEGSRLSAHDYHSSIQKYVKSLPKDEMEDRIMCDCLLPFLPQSLDQQTRRFRLAFETNDRYPIKKSKNEKYTLTNDRRRLRDDYNALRLLNDCLKAAERNEEIDASIATDLWKQIDILMPRFQALMNVLFMPGVGNMLGLVECFLSSLTRLHLLTFEIETPQNFPTPSSLSPNLSSPHPNDIANSVNSNPVYLPAHHTS